MTYWLINDQKQNIIHNQIGLSNNFLDVCKKHSFENYDVYLWKSGGALSIKQLTHRNKNLQITEIKAKPFQHEYDNDLFSFENEIDSFKIVFCENNDDEQCTKNVLFKAWPR